MPKTDFINIKEMSEHLGVIPRTVYKMLAAGQIPALAFKVGKKKRTYYRVRRAEFEQFMEYIHTGNKKK